jgi:hypothetical protein
VTHYSARAEARTAASHQEVSRVASRLCFFLWACALIMMFTTFGRFDANAFSSVGLS